jgi:hypothetical protein
MLHHVQSPRFRSHSQQTISTKFFSNLNRMMPQTSKDRLPIWETLKLSFRQN